MKSLPYVCVLVLPISFVGFWALPKGALTEEEIRKRAGELMSAVEHPPTPVTATDEARIAIEAVRGDVESAGKRYRDFEIEADDTKRLIRATEKKLDSERDRLRRIEAMFAAGEPYVHPIVGSLSAESLENQAELGLIEVAALEQELTGLHSHLLFIDNLMTEVRSDALRGPATLRQLQTGLRLVSLQERFQADREQLVKRLGGTARNLEETANVATLALRRAQNEVSSSPTNFGRLEFPEIQAEKERILNLRSRLNAVGGQAPTVVAFELR
jgi:hypothetical protein